METRSSPWVSRMGRVEPCLMKAGIGGATSGLYEGVVIPRTRRVDIQLRRRHVEIAGKDDGNILA